MITIVFSAFSRSKACFRIHGRVVLSNIAFVLLRQLVAAFAETTEYTATSLIDCDVAYFPQSAKNIALGF